MKINLDVIKNSIRGVDGEGWDGKTINYIDDAIEQLEKLQESLENVSVKGRKNLDALLGCMMGIDMIIGKEEDDG